MSYEVVLKAIARDALADAIADRLGRLSAAGNLTLLESAARLASNNTLDQTNSPNASGVMLFLDVTSVTALQTLRMDVEAKDPASGKYVAIGSSGAIGATATAVGTYALVTASGAANSLATILTSLFVASIALPYVWRTRIIHSGGGNFTYSLGGVYLFG